MAGLFQLRCSEVFHGNETLEARWHDVGPGRSIFHCSASRSASVAARRRHAGAPPARTVAEAGRTEGTMLATVPIVLAIVSFGLLAAGDELAYLDPGALFFASLRWSLLALAGFLLVVALVIGGRATSHRELAGIVAFAFLVFPWPASRCCATQTSSSTRARPRPTKYASCRNIAAPPGGRRGWVEVESWRGDGREHIPLSSADWRVSRALVPG